MTIKRSNRWVVFRMKKPQVGSICDFMSHVLTEIPGQITAEKSIRSLDGQSSHMISSHMSSKSWRFFFPQPHPQNGSIRITSSLDQSESHHHIIWVCLKIVYPYTQWLMIIIPTKWLFHWEYTLFSHHHIISPPYFWVEISPDQSPDSTGPLCWPQRARAVWSVFSGPSVAPRERKRWWFHPMKNGRTNGVHVRKAGNWSENMVLPKSDGLEHHHFPHVSH